MADKSQKYDIVPKEALGARYLITGLGATKTGKEIEGDEEYAVWLKENIDEGDRVIRFNSNYEVGGRLGDDIYGNWALPRTEPFALRIVIDQQSFWGLGENFHKLHRVVNSCRCYSYRGEITERFQKERIYIYFPEDKDGHNILILERYQ